MSTAIRSALESDPLWRVEAFREAVFAIDSTRDDCRRIARSTLLRPLASQLYSFGFAGSSSR